VTPSTQVNTQARSTNESGWLDPGVDPENRLGTPFLKHIVTDQKQFWTSPTRFRVKDLKWIAPGIGITAAFIASDSWWSKQVNISHMQTSLHISDYGTYSLIGMGGASFLLGHVTHNDHLAEAGLLSGEAAIDATGVTYLFKEISQRQRPLQGNGNGDFFTGGASFTSEHSAIAWSIASVLAHEYPGWLSQLAAYGLASTVTITRVTAKQHFPSDVVVGSALGWYFGRQVYRAHHDPELGGKPWGGLLEDNTGDEPRNPDMMGSPYVQLDSWIYPALDRLIALGYIRTAHLGIRPWTRMECARMLSEVGERISNDDSSDIVKQTYGELAREFVAEGARWDGSPNLGAEVESIYARVTSISGRPLRDTYHFGQTIINDFGRPYGEGINVISGASTRAVAGPFAFYIRGEYQHAPAISSDGYPVLQAIANADITLPVSNAIAGANQFDLLEATVSLNLHNVQLSFGKQSQWLGIDETGPWLMSNNAEPILMFKIDSVTPFEIPLLSRVLGPARSEFFIGQLDGHEFELNVHTLLGPGGIYPQPYLHGTKITFKPTDNFEFGIGFTAQFVGPGLPFTWHNFFRSIYSHTGGATDPAKRISEAEFSYRIPHLRDWLTVYLDSLVVDEYSPIGSTRPNFSPGLYMPKFPKLHNLELRAEGIKESLYSGFSPGFVYYGLRRYRSGYTNDGELMGNWIGRAGRGGEGWLTYHFRPRSDLQFGYRHQEVSHDFIGGGRMIDYTMRFDLQPTATLSLSTWVQYEQWRFPVLESNRQSDVTASFQLTLSPPWRIRK
jgi:membrane-associated phospholipid phosphatase